MILIAGVGVFLIGAVLGGIFVASTRWFTQPTKELKETKRKYNKARNTLVKIGSDQGHAVLEAQLALEELDA